MDLNETGCQVEVDRNTAGSARSGDGKLVKDSLIKIGGVLGVGWRKRHGDRNPLDDFGEASSKY